METIHKHHIIPKHMGGTDHHTNIVELTIEQHASAHYKLWKDYGKKEDLLAYMGLSGLMGKEKIIKLLCSHPGEKNPMFGKRGENNPNFGKKRTAETRQKIRSAMIEYSSNRSQDHQMKLKESLYNEKTNMKRISGISRNWEITYPNGNKEIVHNISEWCRNNGFNKGSVSYASKNCIEHKGHKFKKLETS